MFGRCHGKSFEALDVGKAINIRTRVKQHIERNLRLMRHIEDARTGNRVLLIGMSRVKMSRVKPLNCELVEQGRLLAEEPWSGNGY